MADVITPEDNDDNDCLIFEEEVPESTEVLEPWYVLVVDDDQNILETTKLLLKDIKFKDRGVKLLLCLSSAEAKTILNEQHASIAAILLDVIMETEDSGLRLVKYIRNDLNNTSTRIVLRTGQPGLKLRQDVIFNYDINGYKDKATTSSQDLVDSVIVALRGYNDLRTIEKYKDELTELNRSLENKVLARTEEARKATKIAEDANNSKSMFLAAVGHEVRTPMSGIISIVELLDMTSLTLEQKEMVQIIKESTGNLLVIINDLLDFSKIEANRMDLEKAPVLLSDVVSGVYNTLLSVANKKNIALIVDLAKDVNQPILADSVRLKQILFNLVGNAIKFTSRGKVTIKLERLRYSDTSIKIKVSVTDTGIGISEENQRKLFKPFSQADSSTARLYGGTGLGLSICQKLITLMDGELGLDSTVDVGSTFWFTCTFDFSDNVTFERNCTVATPPVQKADKSYRILIADDHPVNAKIIKAQLALLGYNLDIATDGLQAFGLWKTGNYSILLTDCHMPVLNGFELTERIRKAEGSGKRTPIIAVTASLDLVKECLAAGMDSYLVKPITVESLKTELDRFLNIITVETSTTNSSSIVDLDSVKEVFGDDLDMFNDLIEEYIECNQRIRQDFIDALNTNNVQGLKLLGHKISGSASTLGITNLADQGTAIEKLIKANDISTITNRVFQIISEIDKVEEYLLAYKNPA